MRHHTRAKEQYIACCHVAMTCYIDYMQIQIYGHIRGPCSVTTRVTRSRLQRWSKPQRTDMALQDTREHASMSQSKSHDVITLSNQFSSIEIIDWTIRYMFNTKMHHHTNIPSLAHTQTFSQPPVGEEWTTTCWAFGSMRNPPLWPRC